MLRIVAARSDPPRKWEELWAQYPAKRNCSKRAWRSCRRSIRRWTGFSSGLHGVYKLAVVSSSATTEIAPILAAGGIRGTSTRWSAAKT